MIAESSFLLRAVAACSIVRASSSQVDGDSNPHLQSVHIPGFPITTAHFTPDGREVILAGHKKSFHVYDMMAGKITRIYNIRGELTIALCLHVLPSLSKMV